MATNENDDPFDWGTDRLVQEFCSENRSWSFPGPHSRLPDPVGFEAVLRKNELDGYTLLTDVREGDLINIYGLEIHARRTVVRDAIGQLRHRSPKFAAWKLEKIRSNTLPSFLQDTVSSVYLAQSLPVISRTEHPFPYMEYAAGSGQLL